MKWICPGCRQDTPLKVSILAYGHALVTAREDGTWQQEAINLHTRISDVGLNGAAPVVCMACGWDGTMRELVPAGTAVAP